MPTAQLAQAQGPAAPAPQDAQQERIAKLESRIKALEERNEQAAGFHDTDYILKIQKQYETYYEKAFQTEKDTISTLGLIYTAISASIAAILALILAIAGRFTLTVFEEKVENAIRKATADLEAKFTNRMTQERTTMLEANQKQLSDTTAELTKRMDTLISNVRQRSLFDMHFAQGLTFAHAKNYSVAITEFRGAVRTYLESEEGLVTKSNCALALSNLFKTLRASDRDKFEANAAIELEEDIFTKLKCGPSWPSRQYCFLT
ncbi:MAG: hypothetical protein WA734_15310 [Candidatus Acidiferrales bacterium]